MCKSGYFIWCFPKSKICIFKREEFLNYVYWGNFLHKNNYSTNIFDWEKDWKILCLTYWEISSLCTFLSFGKTSEKFLFCKWLWFRKTQCEIPLFCTYLWISYCFLPKPTLNSPLDKFYELVSHKSGIFKFQFNGFWLLWPFRFRKFVSNACRIQMLCYGGSLESPHSRLVRSRHAKVKINIEIDAVADRCRNKFANRSNSGLLFVIPNHTHLYCQPIRTK